MSILRILLITLIGSLAQGQALAQVNVDLEVNAQDELGSQVIAALRDSIQQRRLFRLTSDRASSDVTLKIGTIDPMDGKLAGLQTVYSLVITMKTIDESRISVFVNNYLGVCGRLQVVRCGMMLADTAEEQVSLVVTSLKERIHQPSAAPK